MEPGNFVFNVEKLFSFNSSIEVSRYFLERKILIMQKVTNLQEKFENLERELNNVSRFENMMNKYVIFKEMASKINIPEEFCELFDFIGDYDPKTISINEAKEGIQLFNDFIKLIGSSDFLNEAFFFFSLKLKCERIGETSRNDLISMLQNPKSVILEIFNEKSFPDILVSEFRQYVMSPLCQRICSYNSSYSIFSLNKEIENNNIKIVNKKAIQLSLFLPIIIPSYEIYQNRNSLFLPLSFYEDDYFKEVGNIFNMVSNSKDFSKNSVDFLRFKSFMKENNLEFKLNIKAECERIHYDFIMGVFFFLNKMKSVPNFRQAVQFLSDLINRNDESLLANVRHNIECSYLESHYREALHSFLQIQEVLASCVDSGSSIKKVVLNISDKINTDNGFQLKIQSFPNNMKSFIEFFPYISGYISKKFQEIPEYEYANNYSIRNCYFRISCNNGIELVTANNGKSIGSQLLQLIVSKLNIGKHSFPEERRKKCTSFVNEYQDIVTIYQILKKLYISFEPIEFSQGVVLNQKKSEALQEYNDLNNRIESLYEVGGWKSIHCMPKQQFWVLYSSWARKIYHNISNILYSNVPIRKGVLNQDIITHEKIDLDGLIRFTNSLFKANNYFSTASISTIEEEDKIIIEESQDCFFCPIVSKELSSVFTAIFSFISYYGAFPLLPTQLFICNKYTSISDIKSFLSILQTTNESDFEFCSKSILFFIFHCEQLTKAVSHFLIDELKKIRHTQIRRSHLIMFSYGNGFWEGLNSFYLTGYNPQKRIRQINTDIFKKLYFTYTIEPRIGKSHQIMKTIFQIPNHFYHRVIINNDLQLSDLITNLNSLQISDSMNICIHFDIDSHIDCSFCFMILELVICCSLTDNKQVPFLLGDNYYLFFEFGSKPNTNLNTLIRTIFPIACYMNPIEASNSVSFFELSSYNIENNKVLRIDSNIEVLYTASLYVLLNSKTKKIHNMNTEAIERYLREKSTELSSQPSEVYEVFLSMFRNWQHNNFSFSNIYDLSKYIFTYYKCFINEFVYLQEINVRYEMRKSLLYLLFSQGILTIAIPFYCLTQSIMVLSECSRVENVNERMKRSSFLLMNNNSFSCIYQKECENIKIIKKIAPNILFQQITWYEIQKNGWILFKILDDFLDITKNSSIKIREYRAFIIYSSISQKEKAIISDVFTINTFRKLKTGTMGQKIIPGFSKFSDSVKYFLEDVEIIFKDHPILSYKNKDFEKNEIWLSLNAFINELDHLTSRMSLRCYSLSLHNIKLIMNIMYHLNCNLPILLMGETGSGKTYTLDFLSEILGESAVFKKMVIFSGMNKDSIADFVTTSINTHMISSHPRSMLVFFFDEVNTAPCQWFLKSLIVDRVLNGETLQSNIKFICASNPYRESSKFFQSRIKGIELPTPSFYQGDKKKNLVYQVFPVPLSMYNHIYGADPPRISGDESSIHEPTEFESMMIKVFLSKMEMEAFESASTNEYFSESKDYSQSFNSLFYYNANRDLPQTKEIYEEFFICSLINGARLLTDPKEGFFGDPSISSLRESEHCARICRFVYKMGEYCEKLQGISLVNSFMISFYIVFALRLSSYSEGKECARDRFMSIIFSKLEHLSQKLRFQNNSVQKWNEYVFSIYKDFAMAIIPRDCIVAFNSSLCENVFVSFICLITRIPLWIIGYPGTSKTLAVNLIIKAFLLKHIVSRSNSKSMPSLIKRTYMCSEISQSDVFMEQFYQLGLKAVDYGNVNQTILAMVLEEMGHAELSPFDPLKSLHKIIDSGLEIDGKMVRFSIIGLSNYIIDSAKLNRGLMVIRDEMSNDEKKRTAIDIFKRSRDFQHGNPDNRKMHATQIPESYISELSDIYSKRMLLISRSRTKFFGLRDFYCMIHSIATQNEDLFIPRIFRNFSGDQKENSVLLIEGFLNQLRKEKQYNPFDLIVNNIQEDLTEFSLLRYRHLMIPTNQYSAEIIVRDLISSNQKNVHYLFCKPFSHMPYNEWIANEFTIVSESITLGHTIVFVGHHPCLEELYDLYNMMYEQIDNKSYALLSYAGETYSIEIHKNFKTIVIINEVDYYDLPYPLLNRFEKIPLNFRYTISETDIQYANSIAYSFDINQDLYTLDTFYSSLYSFSQLQLSNEVKGYYMIIHINPSILFSAIKEGKVSHQILSFLHHQSSVSEIIMNYKAFNFGNNQVIAKIFSNWKINGGIQGIFCVSTTERHELLNQIPNSFMFYLNSAIMIEDLKIDFEGEAFVFIIILFDYIGLDISFLRIQRLLFDMKNRYKEEGKVLNIAFIVDSSIITVNFVLFQSKDWPLIHFDACSTVSLLDNNYQYFSTPLSQILFKSPKQFYFECNGLFDKLLDDAIQICRSLSPNTISLDSNQYLISIINEWNVHNNFNSTQYFIDIRKNNIPFSLSLFVESILVNSYSNLYSVISIIHNRIDSLINQSLMISLFEQILNYSGLSTFYHYTSHNVDLLLYVLFFASGFQHGFLLPEKDNNMSILIFSYIRYISGFNFDKPQGFQEGFISQIDSYPQERVHLLLQNPQYLTILYHLYNISYYIRIDDISQFFGENSTLDCIVETLYYADMGFSKVEKFFSEGYSTLASLTSIISLSYTESIQILANIVSVKDEFKSMIDIKECQSISFAHEKMKMNKTISQISRSLRLKRLYFSYNSPNIN